MSNEFALRNLRVFLSLFFFAKGLRYFVVILSTLIGFFLVILAATWCVSAVNALVLAVMSAHPFVQAFIVLVMAALTYKKLPRVVKGGLSWMDL